jgi:NitT/TauT family transport system permease protein
MKRIINQHPGLLGRAIVGILPFILLLIVYLVASEARLAENPLDTVLPSFERMTDTMHRLMFEPNMRTGEYLFWTDTLASLQRIGTAMALTALIGLVFGLVIGMVPWARATLAPLLATVSMIPPLALLPILFIMLGLGELSKIALITLGTTPMLIRNLAMRVEELPGEQIIKAQTLGASSSQVMLRIVLPQLLPRLMDGVRLSFGAAWLFLIAAESVASTEGLGFRVFLVRRYLAMDIILPYVAWITLLAVSVDLSLRQLARKLYPWYGKTS